MSYATYAEAQDLPDEVARSEVESRRFGRGVGRLDVTAAGPGADDDAVCDVVDLVAASDLDVVVLRYPAARVGWFAALRATGRDLIAADTLVYWSRPVDQRVPPADDRSLTLRRAGSEDVDRLDDLVRVVFEDYGSHYAANPLFDPGAAREGYVEWARGYALADEGEGRRAYLPVLEAGAGSPQPAGLGTLLLGAYPEAPLVGVAPACRGRGVYAAILELMADEVRAAGGRELFISTQAHNVVQRAWARLGYRPLLALQTVHLVRPGLLPDAGAVGDRVSRGRRFSS